MPDLDPTALKSLLDTARANYRKTTVGYVNRHWTGPPPSSAWALGDAAFDKALSLLNQVPPPPDVPPPPTPVPTPTSGYEKEVALLLGPSPFALKRDLSVLSVQDFWNKYNNAVPGDRINVPEGMYLPGGSACQFRKAFSGWVQINFVPGKSGISGSDGLYAGCYMMGANTELLNPDIRNARNSGLRFEDCPGPNRVVGSRIYDNAGSGIFVVGITRNCTSPYIEAKLWNNGTDLNVDPHPEPGTGNHACNVGGGNTFQAPNARIALDIIQQQYGAGLSIDARAMPGLEAVIRAQNLGINPAFQARSQTAGNVAQTWNGKGTNIVFRYLELVGVGAQGRMFDNNSQGDMSTCKINYARSNGVSNKSPYITADGIPQNVIYDTRGGIKLLDCR